jgi:hypothetical protein
MSGWTNTTGSHTHGVPIDNYGSGNLSNAISNYKGDTSGNDESYFYGITSAGNHSHSVSVSGSITGGGDSLTQPHCIGVTAIMYAGV